MKFQRGQRVICIAQKNEWDPVLNNFDEALKIALGARPLPEYGKEYVVTNGMSLHYNGKCYIDIEGFNNCFQETAFKELEEKEYSEKEKNRAISILN